MQRYRLNRSSWIILSIAILAFIVFFAFFHSDDQLPEGTLQGAPSDTDEAMKKSHADLTEKSAPPAPFSNELIANMTKGIEKLSPEDRKNLQLSAEYMKAMQDIQPLMLQEHPSMSPEDYRRRIAEVSRLEELDYFSFSEAAQIEKHLAISQYGGSALEAEQARIDAVYAKKYKEAMERNDPAKDPRNMEYQGAENALIQKVLSMDSYPGGLSRDDYLAQETEKLRLRIYGEGK